MTDLHIKIKDQKNKIKENGKKWAVYELEEKVEYGDDDYSEIKLEYDVDKKLERLQPHKDLVLQVLADNKTKEENGQTLVIPQSWNAKKTVLQDIKDKSNEGIRNIGDKTGSDTLKNAADKGKFWWAMPLAIVISAIILGLTIYWTMKAIFSKNEKKQS